MLHWFGLAIRFWLAVGNPRVVHLSPPTNEASALLGGLSRPDAHEVDLDAVEAFATAFGEFDRGPSARAAQQRVEFVAVQVVVVAAQTVAAFCAAGFEACLE